MLVFIQDELLKMKAWRKKIRTQCKTYKSKTPFFCGEKSKAPCLRAYSLSWRDYCGCLASFVSKKIGYGWPHEIYLIHNIGFRKQGKMFTG